MQIEISPGEIAESRRAALNAPAAYKHRQVQYARASAQAQEHRSIIDGLVASVEKIDARNRMLKEEIGQLRAEIGYLTGSMSLLIPVRRIICIVGMRMGISPLDLISARRSGRLIIPRHIVMYLARTTTEYTFTEIGRSMGYRDHSTIQHGVSKIEAMMASNPIFRDKVEELHKEIMDPDHNK